MAPIPTPISGRSGRQVTHSNARRAQKVTRDTAAGNLPVEAAIFEAFDRERQHLLQNGVLKAALETRFGIVD